MGGGLRLFLMPLPRMFHSVDASCCRMFLIVYFHARWSVAFFLASSMYSPRFLKFREFVLSLFSLGQQLIELSAGSIGLLFDIVPVPDIVLL